VISYDRAPLAPALATSPLVTHHRKDAFSALPGAAELDCKLDWIFSDIICYPGKLLEWVKAWLATGIELNFVCTLKFQGDEHYGVIQQFAAIPGSRLVHLFNNKHELTWILDR
jgi:23S rRNA (cytidine2498-2'-O)-methyltransferase